MPHYIQVSGVDHLWLLCSGGAWGRMEGLPGTQRGRGCPGVRQPGEAWTEAP